MPANSRIKLSKYQFAVLMEEVDGLCPLCAEELLPLGAKARFMALSQAAHIYPHSPSEEERILLEHVPMLSDDVEDIDNLIMLCPNCHFKFDHPRTREGYMHMYALKKQLIRRRRAKTYYQKHNIEDDIIAVLQSISNVSIGESSRKLSYSAMSIDKKMSDDASQAIKNLVTRDARDYYFPIKDALIQLEKDIPGKSDMIAKEVSLFYLELKNQGLCQDDIYYAINDWIDARTHRQYSFLTPFITAFYVQNCEVFS